MKKAENFLLGRCRYGEHPPSPEKSRCRQAKQKQVKSTSTSGTAITYRVAEGRLDCRTRPAIWYTSPHLHGSSHRTVFPKLADGQVWISAFFFHRARRVLFGQDQKEWGAHRNPAPWKWRNTDKTHMRLLLAKSALLASACRQKLAPLRCSSPFPLETLRWFLAGVGRRVFFAKSALLASACRQKLAPLRCSSLFPLETLRWFLAGVVKTGVFRKLRFTRKGYAIYVKQQSC